MHIGTSDAPAGASNAEAPFGASASRVRMPVMPADATSTMTDASWRIGGSREGGVLAILGNLRHAERE
jgi:hypothetical protein